MGPFGTGKGPFCRDQLPDFFCGMLWKVEGNLGTAAVLAIHFGKCISEG